MAREILRCAQNDRTWFHRNLELLGLDYSSNRRWVEQTDMLGGASVAYFGPICPLRAGCHFRAQGVRGGRDSARLIRFCGRTRITPWRGESMSAMSMNAIETISGRIGSNLEPALALREP